MKTSTLVVGGAALAAALYFATRDTGTKDPVYSNPGTIPQGAEGNAWSFATEATNALSNVLQSIINKPKVGSYTNVIFANPRAKRPMLLPGRTINSNEIVIMEKANRRALPQVGYAFQQPFITSSSIG